MSENERAPGGIESRDTNCGSRTTGHEPPATPPAPCSRCCANCRFALPVEHKDETLLLCPCRGDRCGRFTVVEPQGGCREFQPRVLARQKEDETTRLIPLVNADGWYAMVDPADYEWLSQYTWRAICTGNTFYACTRCRGKRCLMHRMLMNPPAGMEVDHKNRNGLDNHRINLRNCTRRENSCNRRCAVGVSGYRGVRPCGDKWQACIRHRRKVIPLGLFDDPVEAARVRDRKAIELHGEFACLNFPQEARGRIVGLGGTIRARSGARARLRCVTRGPSQAPAIPAGRARSPRKAPGFQIGRPWPGRYSPVPFGTFVPDRWKPSNRSAIRTLVSLPSSSWQAPDEGFRPRCVRVSARRQPVVSHASRAFIPARPPPERARTSLPS